MLPVEALLVERTWKYSGEAVTAAWLAGGVTQAVTALWLPAFTDTEVMAVADAQTFDATAPVTNFTVQPAGRVPGKAVVLLAASV